MRFDDLDVFHGHCEGSDAIFHYESTSGHECNVKLEDCFSRSLPAGLLALPAGRQAWSTGRLLRNDLSP